MKILAIDTALPAVSACVLDTDDLNPESFESIPMERGHAEALLPLIDRVMARVEGGFASIDRVAVTVGPGSFTGLRVGIAAARAIGLACRVPVIGVSTLAALAAPLILADQPGMVGVAIDARHDQVYFAGFGADGRAFLPPRIMSVRDVARALGNGPARLAGSGAAFVAQEARAKGLNVEIVGNSVTPDIAYVARLGLIADPAHAPARPVYLKPADAKPQQSKTIPLAESAGELQTGTGPAVTADEGGEAGSAPPAAAID
ncbi:tRNA (adenosine(37)-N6)-threonylcarbamoyltransferase complex dimerization subunit type 1 TsaB [Beijerinckia indica]|uniref:Peptidase M22 glycoprotease n=1 Tax=Beijerinckia indica subsp. indica (strain ATCC 9039 / DSM 1715 / NCIMB 8712) TaxID=395963 RepID=B2IIK2_BEII9|nr:tRNA (adenosine(37)-N6)-threonylcarbamoyltransferase complex dimerization subunit type 1 TsaB [Beijerinckia indica]ACB94695.1 peptidase M22 glycoprotease [Beijerinckia indica subsp. indica ATCC 9039]